MAGTDIYARRGEFEYRNPRCVTSDDTQPATIVEVIHVAAASRQLPDLSVGSADPNALVASYRDIVVPALRFPD